MKPSRRSFLRTTVTAPLAAQLGLWGQSPYEAVAAVLPAGQMQFENPQLIRYDAKCFTINGKDTLVVSGAFHYPRCPRRCGAIACRNSSWQDLTPLKRTSSGTITNRRKARWTSRSSKRL